MFQYQLGTLPSTYFNRNTLWTFVTHEFELPSFCPLIDRYFLVRPQRSADTSTPMQPDIMSQTYFQMTLDLIASTQNDTDRLTSFKYTNDSNVNLAYFEFVMNVYAINCSSTLDNETLAADWKVGLNESLNIIDENKMRNMKAILLYRVSAALVKK